jgi:predicted metal-dependent hydrolase
MQQGGVTSMQQIKVRQLNLDLTQGFARHWLNGDAFRTHLFNALSMTFPLGEQYFIDSVRAAMPLVTDPLLQAQVKSFIGQEAAHRHVHTQYNDQLARQGLRNLVEPFIAMRIRWSDRLHPKSKVAITIAYEHFTAIFSDGLLRHPHWLEGADEPMKTLWTWHAVEETEHKSVAFDVYRAAGGGYVRRIGWYCYAGILLSLDTVVQTVHNLYRDGSLFKLKTWRSAARFYLGRQGVVRHLLPQCLAYFRPGFTPWQQDNRLLAERWLSEKSAAYREIGH